MWRLPIRNCLPKLYCHTAPVTTWHLAWAGSHHNANVRRPWQSYIYIPPLILISTSTLVTASCHLKSIHDNSVDSPLSIIFLLNNQLWKPTKKPILYHWTTLSSKFSNYETRQWYQLTTNRKIVKHALKTWVLSTHWLGTFVGLTCKVFKCIQHQH